MILDYRIPLSTPKEPSMTEERETVGRRASDKTREELLLDLAIIEALNEARKESNELYAPIIVKTIVFGLVSLILTAVVLGGLAIWIPTLVKP
jgi:hypothetical protein